MFVGAKFLILNDSGAVPAKITTVPSIVLTTVGKPAYIHTAKMLP
jgi:hypothetical protein